MPEIWCIVLDVIWRLHAVEILETWIFIASQLGLWRFWFFSFFRSDCLLLHALHSVPELGIAGECRKRLHSEGYGMLCKRGIVEAFL